MTIIIIVTISTVIFLAVLLIKRLFFVGLSVLCPILSLYPTPLIQSWTIIALLQQVTDGRATWRAQRNLPVAELSMTFVSPAGVISHRACARVQPRQTAFRYTPQVNRKSRWRHAVWRHRYNTWLRRQGLPRNYVTEEQNSSHFSAVMPRYGMIGYRPNILLGMPRKSDLLPEKST